MTRAIRRRGSMPLLVATLASLLLTIAAGYLTRLSLVETSGWVIHTDQVKLAIADCRRALDHDDAAALGVALAKVERLTVDNPRQQESVARAMLLWRQDSRGALEQLFASMQSEEDGLMAERTARSEAARIRSAAAFLVGAALTLVFAAAAFVVLRGQRQEMSRQRALLEAILESVNEGIIAVEASRSTIAMNAVARAMVGPSYPRDHLPADWATHVRATYEDGSTMEPSDGPLARALRGETVEDVVYRIVPVRAPAAAVGVWVLTTARPIRDESGAVVVAVATLRDITEQRAAAERLRDLSSTDELTGLLNRRGFLANASARIAAARPTKVPLGLLYADVNGLKRINDELGHEHGDQLIKEAATVLRGVFRDGDVLARLGGDEFVALLPNFAHSARDALLERLASAVRAHAERETRPYRLSMSAGITFMDWESAQSLEELLADGDRAMYARKRERAGQSGPVLRVIPPAGTQRS